MINFTAWNVNFLGSQFLEICFNPDANQFNLRVAAASIDLRVGWFTARTEDFSGGRAT
jgi:hypothetical protein